MLIKQIYDEYGLPIEKIINKEYKRLGLKLPEAMVLLALFRFMKEEELSQ